MLKLAPKLLLEPQAVTRKFAFIGISGSGKTFGAGRFVEELYAAGAQTVVVDVMGNWWGLRLAADGKAKGLPIYVFGGLHGDVPLEPTGGKLVADTIVDTNCSVILDVSDMLASEQRRFVADFATQLLRRKRRAPSPLHVVWEECQDLCPEYAPGEMAKCVGAVARLAKQGRNFGVGSSFITQRPQAVSKEVLNQVECLFMFSTAGAHEMKALKDWLGNTVPKDALDSLKRLDPGECFVWSPAWLKRFEVIKFAKKWTFDATATPEFGSAAAAVVPAPLDLKKISSAMADTIERAKESDPAALRAEIGRLKAELARKPAAAAAETKTVEVSVFSEEDKEALRVIQTRMNGFAERVAAERQLREKETSELLREAQTLQTQAEMLGQLVKQALSDVKGMVRGFPPPSVRDREPFRPAAESGGQRVAKEKGSGLRSGARRMLEQIASLDPRPVTRDQVAMLAGITVTSGTFSSYLSDLRRGGYISETGDGFVLASDGWTHLGGRLGRKRAMTHDDLMRLWSPKLRSGARKMLETLVGGYPNDMARGALADAVGIVESSGTFSSYLSDLRRMGVMIDSARGRVRASDDLFPT